MQIKFNLSRWNDENLTKMKWNELPIFKFIIYILAGEKPKCYLHQIGSQIDI